MARQVGEVLGLLARLPVSHDQVLARSASLRGVAAVRRPCSRQQAAPGRRRRPCGRQRRQEQRHQLEREQRLPDQQQRLLSHKDNLLRHGLVARRDRRPAEAAWLER